MAGVLALIGGLAAACFLNAYGIAFLGRPRSAAAETAQEAPPGMRAGMFLLAVACLVLGLAPAPFLERLVAVVQPLIPGSAVTEEIPNAGRVVGWAAMAILAAAVIVLATRTKRRVRRAPIWACGLAGLTPRMQYTSSAFSKPLRSVFSTVYKADRKLDFLPADQNYFPASISYQSWRTTSWEKSLYRPIAESVVGLAVRLRRLQTGNIQGYLLYIFLTLIALLALVRIQK